MNSRPVGRNWESTHHTKGPIDTANTFASSRYSLPLSDLSGTARSTRVPDRSQMLRNSNQPCTGALNEPPAKNSKGREFVCISVQNNNTRKGKCVAAVLVLRSQCRSQLLDSTMPRYAKILSIPEQTMRILAGLSCTGYRVARRAYGSVG